MNDLVEKKWFIFVKDKHEGPFGMDEIRTKITQGAMPMETYVWKEGMSDWKMTSALPEFQSIFSNLKQNREASVSLQSIDPASQGGFFEAVALPSNNGMGAPPSVDQKIPENTLGETGEQILADQAPNPASGNLANSLIRRFPKWKPLLGLISFLILAIVLMQGFYNTTSNTIQDETSEFKQTFMMRVAERLPFLEGWISALPALDVSEEEYGELKSAAKTKLQSVGPKFALGLSRKDLLFPEFFLASNLPDGARLKVHIIGSPSTLLNWLTFEKETEVTLTRKLSRTGAIHFQDGKPIPRGEYIVSISASENQPQNVKSLVASALPVSANLPSEIPTGVKVLAFKTYFLGGPHDAVYVTRLKEFHDRLREKAGRELNELKQFSATLENQFDTTITRFSTLREGRTRPKQKKLWSDFHQEWIKLEASLNAVFDDWTPAVIHDQFFYGVLYQLIHQLGQSLDRVHSFQHAFFASAQDLKTLQIQIGETTAAAQGALILLKSKIEQAEKIPPSVNGMPRTEGL